MRKILRQKFWSLGTTLGSLGPGSQGDVHPRACKCQIQVTRSLALKGHGIQGSLVKILPKIRVTFSSQLVKVKGLRVNP